MVREGAFSVRYSHIFVSRVAHSHWLLVTSSSCLRNRRGSRNARWAFSMSCWLTLSNSSAARPCSRRSSGPAHRSRVACAPCIAGACSSGPPPPAGQQHAAALRNLAAHSVGQQEATLLRSCAADPSQKGPEGGASSVASSSAPQSASGSASPGNRSPMKWCCTHSCGWRRLLPRTRQ